MNLVNHFVAMIPKAVDLTSGRVSRHDYWFYVLETVIVSTVLSILLAIFRDIAIIGAILSLVISLISLALSLVSLSLAVQRVRDANHSGWYYCMVFIPIVGWIFLLIALVQPSGTSDITY